MGHKVGSSKASGRNQTLNPSIVEVWSISTLPLSRWVPAGMESLTPIDRRRTWFSEINKERSPCPFVQGPHRSEDRISVYCEVEDVTTWTRS